jgi:hypothetical protein
MSRLLRITAVGTTLATVYLSSVPRAEVIVGMVGGVFIAVTLLMYLAVFAIGALRGNGVPGARGHSPTSAWVAVSCLTIFSVIVSAWPRSLAFRASRTYLAALEQSVVHGQHLHTPCWAGAHRVLAVERRGAHVFLWTNLNSSGREGLVRSSSCDLNLNLWSCTALDERWRFVVED